MALGPRLLLLLPLLLSTVLTRTGAAPAPRAHRNPPEARGCQLGHYRSLSPQELQAFKRAKDALEDWLLLKDWNCSSRLFPKSRDLRQLQVWERPVVLEAELALTLKVLGGLSESPVGRVLDQPLLTLHHILSQLQACVPAQPTVGPRHRGRLQHWLHRLQQASQKESQSCLEASVTWNLFRLLTSDLSCVASGDQCV